MNYSLRRIKLQNGEEKLMIDFDDNKEILSTFLETEVSSFQQAIINCLEDVLSGSMEYEEFNGNVCGLEVRKEKTVLYDNLTDNVTGSGFEIETSVLLDLVRTWIKELKKIKALSK